MHTNSHDQLGIYLIHKATIRWGILRSSIQTIVSNPVLSPQNVGHFYVKTRGGNEIHGGTTYNLASLLVQRAFRYLHKNSPLPNTFYHVLASLITVLCDKLQSTEYVDETVQKIWGDVENNMNKILYFLLRYFIIHDQTLGL